MITSVFARTFEKLLKKHLIRHLDENQVVSKCQHGFWKGRSTETALLTAMNDWTAAVDTKEEVHVVYFDFTKAFDKVTTGRLVNKLKHVGVHPRAVRWIENFLDGRSYKVRIGETFSSVRQITSGVPQGGVLSPLLFLV